MSLTNAQKQAAWRERRRQQTDRLLSVWLPAATFTTLRDLAIARKITIRETLVSLIHRHDA
jgi:hypothetical protein